MFLFLILLSCEDKSPAIPNDICVDHIITIYHNNFCRPGSHIEYIKLSSEENSRSHVKCVCDKETK